MERQGKEITKIQKLLSDAEGVWKQLPKLVDLQTGTNQTLDAVVKATESMNKNSEACKLKKVIIRVLKTAKDGPKRPGLGPKRKCRKKS